jgi:hypothetical protein
MSAFEDLEYCKTDLAASRGVVFCKFAKSSSALKALEAIGERGNVSVWHAHGRVCLNVICMQSTVTQAVPRLLPILATFGQELCCRHTSHF